MRVRFISFNDRVFQFQLIVDFETFSKNRSVEFHKRFQLKNDLKIFNYPFEVSAGVIRPDKVTYTYTIKQCQDKKMFLQQTVSCFEAIGIGGQAWSDFFYSVTGARPRSFGALHSTLWHEIVPFAGTTARARLPLVSKQMKGNVYDPKRDLRVQFPKVYQQLQQSTKKNDAVEEKKESTVVVKLTRQDYQHAFKKAYQEYINHPWTKERPERSRFYTYLKEGDLASIGDFIDCYGFFAVPIRASVGYIEEFENSESTLLFTEIHELWKNTQSPIYKKMLNQIYVRAKSYHEYTDLMAMCSQMKYAIIFFQFDEVKRLLPLIATQPDTEYKSDLNQFFYHAINSRNIEAIDYLLQNHSTLRPALNNENGIALLSQVLDEGRNPIFEVALYIGNVRQNNLEVAAWLVQNVVLKVPFSLTGLRQLSTFMKWLNGLMGRQWMRGTEIASWLKQQFEQGIKAFTLDGENHNILKQLYYWATIISALDGSIFDAFSSADSFVFQYICHYSTMADNHKKNLSRVAHKMFMTVTQYNERITTEVHDLAPLKQYFAKLQKNAPNFLERREPVNVTHFHLYVAAQYVISRYQHTKDHWNSTEIEAFNKSIQRLLEISEGKVDPEFREAVKSCLQRVLNQSKLTPEKMSLGK